MKKVFAILLICAMFTGMVFALNNDKIVLESTVGQIKPNFKIYYDTTAGTTEGEHVAVSQDISLENVVATFSIKQEGSLNKNSAVVTYSKYEGPVTLTITLNPFKATIDEVEHTQTTAYTVTAVTKTDDVTGEVTFAKGGTGSASTTLTPTYYGKKVDDLEIGTVTGTWVADPTLPVDGVSTVYTADVVLTYTVV